MKKRLLILIITALAAILCFTACTDIIGPDNMTGIKSIEIVSGSVPTQFKVGDTPDFSGIVVRVTMADGTTKDIGYSDLTISKLDTATAGKKTVNVTYNGFTVSFEVNVTEDEVDATITSIKIVPGSIGLSYYIGQPLDLSQLQVEATFSDGTKSMLKGEEYTFTSVDTSTHGEKTFTVTYTSDANLTDSVTIVVIPISSVTVVKGSVANKINVGETLDVSSIQILVEYENGEHEIVQAADVTVGTIDTATYGIKNLSVTYKGVTVQYPVEVVGAISLTVNKGSVLESVKFGEILDTSKITAYVTYSDNTAKPVETKDLVIGAIDTSKVGQQSLKVSYNGLETEVLVEVVGVETLAVVDKTVAKEIFKGAALDLGNIKVSVKFTDGTTDTLNFEEITVDGIDTNVAGEHKLTVTYLDKTVEYAVNVCEITAISIEGVSDTLQSGKPIDISNMKVYGVYNDSASTKILLTDGEITTNKDEIDKNSTLDKVLTVTYKGEYGEFTTNHTIYASASELVGIEIRNWDKEVLLDREYNKNSVVVYALYENGTNKKITEYSITDVATDVAGDVKLTVTYTENGVTKNAEATVKVCAITSIYIEGVANTVQSGKPIDISKMKVYGIFDDSAETAILLADGEITTNIDEIDINSTLDKVLTVTYKGEYGEFTTNHTVYASAPELVRIEIKNWAREVLLGSEYNKSSVVVNAFYGNGTNKKITEYSITDVATDVAGDVTFTVTYTENGVTKTAEATVKVCTITSIHIEGVSNTVQSGKSIDISNMKVYGIFNDSAETTILLTDGITTNVDSIDINSMSNKTLVVTYAGVYGEFTASHVIFTTAPELDRIEIRDYDKTIGIGCEYDKNSVVVYAVYGNGQEKPATGFSVSDVATNSVGEVIVTVTYIENGVTKTATAKVQVCPVAKLEVSGIPALVNKGDTLDTSAIRVLVTFSDGFTRVVGKADVTVSDPDTATGGDKQLTVSYFGAEVNVTYHVKAVSSISIFGGSVDSDLRNGYAVDYSGLILDITYTDGTGEQKKASELTGVTYTGTEVNATSFGVTYEGATASMQLKLINIVSISALNNTVPSTVLQGATMLYGSMKLTVIYDNGDVYLVGNDDANLTISEIDVNKPGTQAITFEYFGYSASANILVKGVQSVEIIEGVLTTINVGQKLDTSKILVRVMYTDGTYFYADINSPYLEIGSIDTETEGTKTLIVKYQGIEGKIDIEVVKIEIDGLIFGALLPDELVARESYKKNFKDSNSPYVVGDDNLFYFYLNVIQLDENDNVVDIDGKSIPTAARVFLVNADKSETELTGDALTAMVTFNSASNSYDFTEAAIGKTFRLEIRPADENSYVDAASVTKSHTVTVVDGYNIYEAWELNVMTNSTRDITSECFGTAGSITQVTVVDKFLATKGVTRPTNLASIVLHGNIDVKPSDLPPEYFYVDDKGVNQGIYDHLGLFHRNLSPSEKQFEIYGNYYSVYSYSVPCVVPRGVANNDDDYSSSDLFRVRLTGEAHTYIRNKQTKEAFSEFVVNIRDIASRDNDPNSNDQTASERHMRGLGCYKIGETVVNMYNVNVDAFMTSMIVENMGSTVNLDKVKFYNAWQGHLFLWSKNEHQIDYGGTNEATWAYIPNLVVNINDSLLAKCGGPVILSQAPEVDDACNLTCGVEVTADEASEIWTYVTGQEAWFVAVGQTQLAASIRAMSPTIGGGHGFTSKEHIQGVETINMVMVAMGNRGTSIEGTTPNASYTKGGVVGLKSHYPTNTTTFQTPVRDYLFAQQPALTQAPLFETNTGGLGYVDATMKCNPINAEFYTGDYITLYYNSMGAGIMMDYYHTNP